MENQMKISLLSDFDVIWAKERTVLKNLYQNESSDNSIDDFIFEYFTNDIQQIIIYVDKRSGFIERRHRVFVKRIEK